MTDIIKRPDAVGVPDTVRDADGQIKFGGPKKGSLADRVAQAKAAGTINTEANQDSKATMLTHRIALVLDCSGSMSGSAITQLQQAASAFVGAVNPADTSIALETFPEGVRRSLTTIRLLLEGDVNLLKAGGGTPLYEALKRTIGDNPITRAILVSDGSPTDGDRDPWYSYDNDKRDAEEKSKTPVEDATLAPYLETKTPIDCVHIGGSQSGEDVMKRIASRTGGVYMKFKDISTFMKAFTFLTPGKRALLMSGDAAKLTGADEIQR